MQKLQKRILYQYCRFFCSFACKKDDYVFIERASQILNKKVYLTNDFINIDGLIKLVDSKGKSIGVYDVNEAKDIAKKQNLDVILMNESSSPQILKLLNYKQQVYEEFMKSISNEDLLQNKQKKVKILKLKPKIQISDLKTKINKAIELSSYNESVTFQMGVNEDTKQQGLNIMYNVLKMTEMHLKNRYQNIIQKSNLELKNPNETTILEIQLDSLEVKSKSVWDFNENQIQHLINVYFSKSSHQNNWKSLYEEKEIQELHSSYQEDQHKIFEESTDIDHQAKEKYEQDKKDNSQKIDQEYITMLQEYAQNYNRVDRESLQIAIQMSNMNKKQQQQVVSSLSEEQKKNVQNYKRDIKMFKLINGK